MKKVSTAAVKATKNFSQQKLTIGLDLGDRSSWYCLLDEVGEVLLEQKVSTSPKAMREVFGSMPRCRIALETGMHSPPLAVVSEFYKKGCQEKSSASTGGEISFSRSSPLKFHFSGEAWPIAHAHKFPPRMVAMPSSSRERQA
jgi:hypothetical protein